MPELRKDPITGRWVIISSERIIRPTQINFKNVETPKEFCPFCEGNEKYSPNEIFAISENPRDKDTPGWEVRVIPNKFPALKVEGELNKRGIGLYDMMNGVGAHEIIIETPNHNLRMSQMPITQIKKIIQTYIARMYDLKKDIRFEYALIFKNHGQEAGATISHSHSQLIAFPVIPKRVQEEKNGAKKYYDYRDRCIYCDIIAQELYSQKRIILDEKNFIVIAPFASRQPFETWILPKNHKADFLNITEDEIDSLANVLLETLKKLDTSLLNPPFNFVLHTSGYKDTNNDYYHWHIEIIPKLTKMAGFEWGSGFYINPTPPEEAVKFLI